jgi:cyclopropane fatty-acyl-phospholipid synthase-like methyltransferase
MAFDVDTFSERHFAELAAAFCRGRLSLAASTSHADALTAGHAAGLRLHKFKRSTELPRIRRVLGTLRSFAPASLLDIGSGRGVFLWPLLDALPEVSVTAVDVRADRVADLRAVATGGVARLSASEADVHALPFDDGSFELVTVLEVLEHVGRPAVAASEAMRVATRAVLASVPTKEDDNPEHIHLFSASSLRELFTGAGASRVDIEHVRGHAVVVALR